MATGDIGRSLIVGHSILLETWLLENTPAHNRQPHQRLLPFARGDGRFLPPLLAAL